MILSALLTSLCISLLFFFIDLITSTAQWAILTMIVAFLVSFIIIVVFGIPLVLILKKYNKLKWFNILIGGFLIGFIFSFAINILSIPTGDNGDMVNREILMIHGVITTIGWIRHIQSSIIPGIIG